jgi:UrcA family protein
MRLNFRMLLLSVLAVAAISPAMANDAAVVNVKSEVVHFDDLRLISTVGAAVLYARIERAADRACGGPSDNLQLAAQQRYRVCMDETLGKAVSDVNHPILNQYYESKRRNRANNPPSSVAKRAD